MYSGGIAPSKRSQKAAWTEPAMRAAWTARLIGRRNRSNWSLHLTSAREAIRDESSESLYRTSTFVQDPGVDRLILPSISWAQAVFPGTPLGIQRKDCGVPRAAEGNPMSTAAWQLVALPCILSALVLLVG
jgi:hypothetical protein